MKTNEFKVEDIGIEDLKEAAAEVVESGIRTVVHTPSEVVNGFVPSLNELKETGKINEDNYFFFDLKTEKYIHIVRSLGEVEYFKREGAIRAIGTYAEKAGIDLGVLKARRAERVDGVDIPGKKEESLVSYIKDISSEFNPREGMSWDIGLKTYLNEFVEEITKLKEVNEARKEGEKLKDLEFLKDNAPRFFALLMNLLENNEDNVKHFINYVSTFANTRKKVPAAYMFAGIEGSGKGVLLDILKMIFGETYVADVMADSLSSDFQDQLNNKLVVNFNEVSTDFNRKDKTTQLLKFLITQKKFNMNRKGLTNIEIDNNFIVLLNTNELHSLKISATDRRFNYFKQERTLADVAVNDFNQSIGEFVNEMKEEIDEIIEFIGRYDYSVKQSEVILETENRALNILATENSSKVMFKYIRDMDLNNLMFEFQSNVDTIAEKDKMSLSQETLLTILDVDKFTSDIEEGFDKGVISMSNLGVLVEVILGEKYSRNALSKMYRTNGLSNKKSVRINGSVSSCIVLKEV